MPTIKDFMQRTEGESWLGKKQWRTENVEILKTEFARGPGRGDTSHLSDLDETLPY